MKTHLASNNTWIGNKNTRLPSVSLHESSWTDVEFPHEVPLMTCWQLPENSFCTASHFCRVFIFQINRILHHQVARIFVKQADVWVLKNSPCVWAPKITQTLKQPKDIRAHISICCFFSLQVCTPPVAPAEVAQVEDVFFLNTYL